MSNKPFGSPFDRGVNDKYHGHKSDPHCYRNINGRWVRITDLTNEEVQEYYEGYNSPL